MINNSSLVFLSLVIFFSSCENKRIRELEKENRELKTKLEKLLVYKVDSILHEYVVAKKAIADSIVFDKPDERYNSMLCGWTRLFSYNLNKTARLHLKYKSNYIITDLNSPEYETLKYTRPSKQRKDYKFKENYIISKDEQISFIPNDTGYYYWTGQLVVKNPRTGKLTYYPIQDSIYVY